MTDQDTGSPYMIFILVFSFFITGLLGLIICNMLKKRGYRCRAGESEEEDCKSTHGAENDDEVEDNEDTVEGILKCIIENEANMEAFSELLGNQNPAEHQDQRLLRKESLRVSPPHHHHTIHLGSDQNFCLHCGQGHSKKIQHRNQAARSKSRAVEQTVFSVGRFRVTHTEKKNNLQNSTHPPIPGSTDRTEQLDRENNQESYNIHNMFRGIEAANASKQKGNVTPLGLRGDNGTINSEENPGNSEPLRTSEGKRIVTPPESQPVGEMSLTKSEVKGVKVVRASAGSSREFSVETLSSAPAEEGRVNTAKGKSL